MAHAGSVARASLPSPPHDADDEAEKSDRGEDTGDRFEPSGFGTRAHRAPGHAEIQGEQQQYYERDDRQQAATSRSNPHRPPPGIGRPPPAALARDRFG